MVQSLDAPTIVYPDSDGQPMADNTLQFQWIVVIKENLEVLFADDPNVFVAGDLLWYPLEGNNKTCQAPDVMVAIGRPKGYRGSYKQWEEEGIAPQVVFEILSPSNRLPAIAKKLKFYECHGVEEYYLYDPDRRDLAGLLRRDGGLETLEDMAGWTSPRLQIRFETDEQGELHLFYPDGRPFLTTVELHRRAEAAAAEAQLEKQRADRAEAQLAAMRAKLQELGIDPDGAEV